jgi:hypothetical protein
MDRRETLMSSSRIRIQAAVVGFLLLPAAAGVLAVHASANCERFVRKYVTKPVRNRVSKQTAEAWALWRQAHPNWKPNPNVVRPKYVMNREEAVEKVDFACTMPVIPAISDRLLQISELEPPPPAIDLSRMNPTPIALPDEIPPEVAELTPDTSWPALGPFVPPILGGPPGGGPVYPLVPPEPPPLGGAVPEPTSLVLVGSGMACLCLMLGFGLRRDRTESA